jgi:hypothetical protein
LPINEVKFRRKFILWVKFRISVSIWCCAQKTSEFWFLPPQQFKYRGAKRPDFSRPAGKILAIFSRLKLETMHRAFSAKLPQQPIFGAIIFRRALGNVHFEATKMFVMLLPK